MKKKNIGLKRVATALVMLMAAAFCIFQTSKYMADTDAEKTLSLYGTPPTAMHPASHNFFEFFLSLLGRGNSNVPGANNPNAGQSQGANAVNPQNPNSTTASNMPASLTANLSNAGNAIAVGSQGGNSTNALGNNSGQNTNQAGNSSSNNPQNYSPDNSGNNSGDNSGDNSGSNPTENPGDNSGNNPGDDSGNNSGNGSGNNSGGSSGGSSGNHSGNSEGGAICISGCYPGCIPGCDAQCTPPSCLLGNVNSSSLPTINPTPTNSGVAQIIAQRNEELLLLAEILAENATLASQVLESAQNSKYQTNNNTAPPDNTPAPSDIVSQIQSGQLIQH